MNRTEQLREKLLNWPKDSQGVPTNLEALALTHWELHRPQMFDQLKKAGTLEARAKEAAQSTKEMMESMVSSGMRPWEAWEEVREQAMLLPESESPDEPEDDEDKARRELFELTMETNRLTSKVNRAATLD